MVSLFAGQALPVSTPLAGRSYWQRHGGAPDDAVTTAPAVQTPATADYVIVGGGFAGLSTALALAEAEPAASIVLLEARFLGFGASGRNAGLLSPLPAPVWLITAGRNAEHAWALQNLNRRVKALGERLAADVPDSGIAPAVLRLEAQGRLTSAGLARVARTLDAAGIACDKGFSANGRLRVDLAAHTLHPFRAVRALGDIARRRGVTIHEGVAVLAIVETPAGARLTLAGGGTIEARSVVVCTNAYTGSLALPQKPSAKVVCNFMVATGPADTNRLARNGDLNRFVVELNTDYVFYRRHAGRVLYGGIERFKPQGADDFALGADVLSSLERHLGQTFPGAGLVPAEAWGGIYHQTPTDLPVIRRIGQHGSIVLNVGYGGTGVAMTQICGALAASLARGVAPTETDDRRLQAAIDCTRVPLAGMARFVTGVARDLVVGPRRVR